MAKMVVILSIAMSFTHLLRYGANVYKMEGFDEKKGEEGEEVFEQEDDEEDIENKRKIKEFTDLYSNSLMPTEVGSEGMKNKDSSGNEIMYDIPEFDIKSFIPTMTQNTEIQQKIFEKLTGIEKFTSQVNDYIS